MRDLQASLLFPNKGLLISMLGYMSWGLSTHVSLWFSKDLSQFWGLFRVRLALEKCEHWLLIINLAVLVEFYLNDLIFLEEGFRSS